MNRRLSIHRHALRTQPRRDTSPPGECVFTAAGFARVRASEGEDERFQKSSMLFLCFPVPLLRVFAAASNEPLKFLPAYCSLLRASEVHCAENGEGETRV